MTSDGFEEIIWGMKLPDDKQTLRLAPSAFLRVLKRVRTHIGNAVIVLENIDAISQAQRDQLAELLMDLADNQLQIDGKPIKLPLNTMVILRTRKDEVLETWRFINQVSLKTLNPTQNEIKCHKK